MDNFPLTARILKSLIAPARHGDGSTLYVICRSDDEEGFVIYEQLPDGKCLAWPELASGGVQQAEGTIYQRAQLKECASAQVEGIAYKPPVRPARLATSASSSTVSTGFATWI